MSNTGPTEGKEWYGKEVLEIKELSKEGWRIYRVDGNISADDFIVKVINPNHPRGIKIKHAHFAIDFFGKLLQDEDSALRLFEGIIEMWRGADPQDALQDLTPEAGHLRGYDLEFILFTMDCLLKQKYINLRANPGRRDEKKQKEIDDMLAEMDIRTPKNRKGSQLVMSLFSDIAAGTHPVEALYRVGLDVQTIR